MKRFYIIGAGFSREAGFPLAGTIGQQVIEDKETVAAGHKQFSPADRIFEPAFQIYNNRKHDSAFEELWINLIQEGNVQQPASPEWWLTQYFSFAVRHNFIRRCADVLPIASPYRRFFRSLSNHSDPLSSDCLLYMNWDPLPELYCGVCHANSPNHRDEPRMAPVGASTNDSARYSQNTIPIFRPAGGIHILQAAKDRKFVDRTGQLHLICEQDRIYLERNLDMTRRQGIWIQAGDAEFMIFPESEVENTFTQGQLAEAKKHFKKAKEIIIIGYSFPHYDQHIRQWIQQQYISSVTFKVIDPASRPGAVEFLQKAFGNELRIEHVQQTFGAWAERL